MYWGIDGCRGGWIAIGFDAEGGYLHDVYVSLDDFWRENQAIARTILIDMPIGLPFKSDRECDSLARKIIKPRGSSVFPVPSRSAVQLAANYDFDPSAYREVCDHNQAIIGKRFPKQTWNILPKIYEVDQLLQNDNSARKHFYEAHPEVLFWALNGQKALRYSKKQGLGFYERIETLEQFLPEAADVVQNVYDQHHNVLADDDVVDALACASCARIAEFQSLPEEPELDEIGLPMRMVYPLI